MMEERTEPWRAAAAGIAASTAVFAAGFVLGTIRVLLVAPRFGSLASVLIEIPLMLIASWAVTGTAIRHWRVDHRFSARMVMGTTAFALLIIAEALLGIAVLGQSPSQWLGAFSTPAGAAGLIAQLAFGFMPIIQMMLPRSTT